MSTFHGLSGGKMVHPAGGVAVGVGGACVAVAAGVEVRVGVRVGVRVRAGVAVTADVMVAAGVGVGVAAMLGNAVWVGVTVGTGVDVAVTVGGSGVAVPVAVDGNGVAVAGRGVAVGVASLPVGVAVGVAVRLGTCLCDPALALALAVKQDAVTSKAEVMKDRDFAARMAQRAASAVPGVRRRFHGARKRRDDVGRS